LRTSKCQARRWRRTARGAAAMPEEAVESPTLAVAMLLYE